MFFFSYSKIMDFLREIIRTVATPKMQENIIEWIVCLIFNSHPEKIRDVIDAALNKSTDSAWQDLIIFSGKDVDEFNRNILNAIICYVFDSPNTDVINYLASKNYYYLDPVVLVTKLPKLKEYYSRLVPVYKDRFKVKFSNAKIRFETLYFFKYIKIWSF